MSDLLHAAIVIAAIGVLILGIPALAVELLRND